jgi:hypothetical protein
MTDETKAKIALSQKGKRYALGCHRTDETKAKLSESHREQVPWNKGCRLTNEHKMKLSAALKGRYPTEAMKARRARVSVIHLTDEHKAKISAAHWKGGHTVTQRKIKAKRRTLGFVPINDPFPGCEGHHLDKERVVYIPWELHKSIGHNIWTGRNMERINAVAMQWLAQGP